MSETSFQAVLVMLGDIVGEVRGVDTRLSGVADRLGGVDTRLGGVADRLSGVDTRLGGVADRLGGVDTRLSGVADRLGGVDTRLSGVADRLGGVDTRLSGVADRLAAMEAWLEARLGAVESRLDRLEADQTRYRIDLMERMDRQANQLTLLRDDIGVNMGAINHVRESNVATRKEVQSLEETVAIMTRKIFRLETDIRQLRGEE